MTEKNARPRLILLALTLGLLGLSLSYAVFDVVVDNHRAALENDFQLEVNRQLAKLEQGLAQSVERIRSVSAFFYSFGDVGEAEFRSFTAPYLRQAAGLDLLGWAAIEISEEPPDPNDESLSAGISLPLSLIEPGPVEGMTFGDDLMAIPKMRAAVDRSFELGEIQHLKMNDNLVLIMPTLDEVDWSGLVMAVLPEASMLAWLGDDWNGAVSIIDQVSGELILQLGNLDASVRPFQSTMTFGSEMWAVTATSTSSPGIPAVAWGTLLTGIAITALLLILIVTLAGSADRAERLVALRTRELEQAEAEARSQAVRLANEVTRTNQVIASIPSILIGVDNQGVITMWNRATKRASGIPYADARDKRVADCGWSGDTLLLADAIDQCLEDCEARRLDNLQFAGHDGTEATIGMTVIPVRDSEERLNGCLVIGADITERNKMEVQLRESQRLEAVGRLAAGIAHEVNTPAQFVSDNTTFLKEAFDDLLQLENVYSELLEGGSLSDEQRSRLNEARDAADREFLVDEVPQALAQSMDGIRRIADIVRAMKEFSHPGGGGQKEQVDFNRLITNAVTVAANEWKYHAEIETSLDPELPPVSCFPRELNQVVLNLLINAAHSIADAKGDSGERGKITISTAAGSESVELRLTDTGTGIPEHVRGKIFEPFFTTKEVGRGSGQGLALAYSAVVEKHGGELSFETESGVGTTFIVSLPLAAQDRKTGEIA